MSGWHRPSVAGWVSDLARRVHRDADGRIVRVTSHGHLWVAWWGRAGRG